MDHSLVTVTIAIFVDNDGLVSVRIRGPVFNDGLFLDGPIAIPIAMDFYSGRTNSDAYIFGRSRNGVTRGHYGQGHKCRSYHLNTPDELYGIELTVRPISSVLSAECHSNFVRKAEGRVAPATLIALCKRVRGTRWGGGKHLVRLRTLPLRPPAAEWSRSSMNVPNFSPGFGRSFLFGNLSTLAFVCWFDPRGGPDNELARGASCLLGRDDHVSDVLHLAAITLSLPW